MEHKPDPLSDENEPEPQALHTRSEDVVGGIFWKEPGAHWSLTTLQVDCPSWFW